MRRFFKFQETQKSRFEVSRFPAERTPPLATCTKRSLAMCTDIQVYVYAVGIWQSKPSHLRRLVKEILRLGQENEWHWNN